MSQPAPLGVIETDAFCEGCGFNLHTQSVWRDERLDIAVCRCPECGRHAAAGRSTTTDSAWLRRLALAGLVAWLAVQLAFATSVFGGMCAAHAWANEALTQTGHMTRDGRPVLYRQVPTASGASFEFAAGPDAPFTLPASDVIYGVRLAPWITGVPDVADPSEYGTYATAVQAAIVVAFLSSGILVAGVVFASLAWYWRRGGKWLWLLVPVTATALFALLVAHGDYRSSGTMWTGVTIVNSPAERWLTVWVGAWMTLTLAVGIALGRRVARLAISVLVPPKSRQLFAFLWHCDGLTMKVPKVPRE